MCVGVIIVFVDETIIWEVGEHIGEGSWFLVKIFVTKLPSPRSIFDTGPLGKLRKNMLLDLLFCPVNSIFPPQKDTAKPLGYGYSGSIVGAEGFNEGSAKKRIRKLRWQWNNKHLQMYFLLNMVHGHASFEGGKLEMILRVGKWGSLVQLLLAYAGWSIPVESQYISLLDDA